MKEPTAKPRLSLLPWRAVTAVAALMTREAVRHHDAPGRPGYLDHEAMDYVDAALRHLAAHLSGERMDESGAPHLVCAASDMLIAVELQQQEG